MFVAGNFVSALAMVLDMVLTFYMWVIIARAVLSWVNPDPYNPIVQFLYKVTEPVLKSSGAKQLGKIEQFEGQAHNRSRRDRVQ